MPRFRTVRAFSAGGVVYRRQPQALQTPLSRAPNDPPVRSTGPAPDDVESAPDDVEIVLVGRALENFWVLPKGTPREGESTAEVALREVEEETGIKGRIVGELGSIHYWFSRHGTRFNKEVFYFLMEAVGGDVSLHDHEYEDALWFPLRDATQRLAYANEAEMARAAWQLMRTWAETPRDV